MPEAGRPRSSLEGLPEEVWRLALWLQQLTRGHTVRTLEQKFGTPKKTLWGDYLSGKKVIPAGVLERLVNDLVEPRLIEKRLAQGNDLRRAAEATLLRPARQVPVPTAGYGEVKVLQTKLVAALEGQVKAERAEHRANSLVQMLIRINVVLQDQCARLSVERDRALAEARVMAVTEAHSQLKEAERQLTQAQQELDRARQERTQAEEIKIAAQRAAEEYRRALEDLQAKVAEQAAFREQRATVDVPKGPDRTLQDSAVLLERVTAELDDQAEDLAHLREEMGLAPAPSGQAEQQSVRIVPGMVVDNADTVPGAARDTPPAEPEPVSEASADNADNLPTSTEDSAKDATWFRFCAVHVTLPELGEEVTEGVVVRWLKAVGDRVEADEPLLEVSTDKVDTEIPSPCGGTLKEILVRVNETCQVGGTLAVIAEEQQLELKSAPVRGVVAEPEKTRAGAGHSTDGKKVPPEDMAPALDLYGHDARQTKLLDALSTLSQAQRAALVAGLRRIGQPEEAVRIEALLSQDKTSPDTAADPRTLLAVHQELAEPRLRQTVTPRELRELRARAAERPWPEVVTLHARLRREGRHTEAQALLDATTDRSQADRRHIEDYLRENGRDGHTPA